MGLAAQLPNANMIAMRASQIGREGGLRARKCSVARLRAKVARQHRRRHRPRRLRRQPHCRMIATLDGMVATIACSRCGLFPSSHGVVRTWAVVARQQPLCADCRLFGTGLHAPGALNMCLLRVAPSSGACSLREREGGPQCASSPHLRMILGCVGKLLCSLTQICYGPESLMAHAHPCMSGVILVAA